MSVQGVGVVVGGHPALVGALPVTMASAWEPWAPAGRRVGFIFHAQLIPPLLGCWKPAMGQDGFPCSHFLAGFTWGTGSSRKTPKPTSPSGSHLCCWSLVLLAPPWRIHTAVGESGQCPGAFGIPVSGDGVGWALMCSVGRGGGKGMKQHAWSCRGLGLRCRRLSPAPCLLQGAAGMDLGAGLSRSGPCALGLGSAWAVMGTGTARWGQGQHGCGSAGLGLGCCLARPGFRLCLTCLGKAATRQHFAAGSIHAALKASAVPGTIEWMCGPRACSVKDCGFHRCWQQGLRLPAAFPLSLPPAFAPCRV